MTDELWAEMVAIAKSKSLKAGDYKKLNLPFENKLFGLPREIRERMAKGVEDFVYELLTKVFNAQDTAPLAIEAILKAGSYDLGPKAQRIENPADWTEQKIKERASKLHGDKGHKGNFDD
jgi:fructose-bisphosphate aldolase class II